MYAKLRRNYDGSQEFLNICKAKVAEYYNQKKDKTDATPTMTVNDVFVVWYSKSLQNHKLCSVRLYLMVCIMS